MKLKYFLLSVLILGALRMPALAYVEDAAPSNSASGGLADELFTFDPNLSSIKLEYVDFKIGRGRTVSEWGKDIGRYNFKLFGCRRNSKKLILNEGRAMRRDMKFQDVFFEEMNELFPVVVNKDSPYFPYSVGDRIPGYVITAEIKDLFVNVCDHYDWRTRSYPRLRSGSAEIKVLWRVMTPFNRKLYWEDTTYGYADIQDPVRNGEVRLIEKAFADAVARMIGAPGFIDVMRDVPSEEEIGKAKADYDAMVYAHIQNRRNLMSSYRRKRMKFYHERERVRILNALEKIGQRNDALASLIMEKEKNINSLTDEQLEHLVKEQAELASQISKETQQLGELAQTDVQKGEEIVTLTERAKRLVQKGELNFEEQDELNALLKEITEKSEDLTLDAAVRADIGYLLDSDEQQYGILGRLLKNARTEQGFYGRLLKDMPLIRLFDGFLLESSLESLSPSDGTLNDDLFREAKKYGFEVSKADGTITIANQKPFRYLSPNRIYRIRSSVVAVLNDKDVGSGVVIAPSLVLTNYSIAKKSPYIKIEFLDGRIKSAMVLRANQEKDVALLFVPPKDVSDYTWAIPVRLDLPQVGEEFYAIGTPMRGGFEGAMENGRVAGYRYGANGVDILTDTNVQSVSLGGLLVDGNGNAVGLAHAGENLVEVRDGFIPLGDAFDALNIRIRDRSADETPTQKALRLKKEREENYIK